MRRRMWRIAAASVAVIVVIAGLSACAAAEAADRQLNKIWRIEPSVVAVPEHQEAVARGKHLSEAVLLCSDCHGADLGGRLHADLPGVATVVAPNITRGKGSAVIGYSTGDWARAVRHGVDRKGRPLVAMPSQNYQAITDEDLGALLAYVQQVPPVDRAPGTTSVGPIGRLLAGMGTIDLVAAEKIDHTARPASFAVDDLAARGAYLARMSGCVDCHGATLSGGPLPGTPPDMPKPSNLTPHETGLGSWTFEQFDTALRRGQSKDGRALHPMMPSKQFAGMADDEVRALWTFLRTVTAKPFGGH